ncbi:hypothetical protein PFICI_00048 [Pestalotiopsis fici W106-1]|uniref:Concanavalin A-like lectin/glucanase n=1 Tax=Pestalotiopsis fici (strain W106-1 / CGMCC3.15140) TaxID=1229662 RepID=W3XJQ4_PESFW|nr:uncharacterized protein PFICI_00048 [Pestalotiopsis fici W106-1]ETS86220.1 hypothetical protein PFICI_00048 [Pestalotiopsis fici W106-1]
MKSSLFLSALVFALSASSQATTYDTTWAGPVRIAERFNGTAGGFDRVEATLVMPELSIPANPRQQSDEYTASFWIGFSGFLSSATALSGLWQAGVVMSIWENGTTEYTGFYEWVPEDPIQVNATDLAISAGDHLEVILTTTNNGLVGSVVMTNLNTSQQFSYSQDAPVSWRGPTWPALGTSAEWIMEAGTYLNGPQYIFPDWSNATIIGAKACYSADSACFPPVSADNTSLNAMTAVYWNDTQTLYTKSYVENDVVTIEYVEEVVDLS